jgi:hypothetical protein
VAENNGLGVDLKKKQNISSPADLDKTICDIQQGFADLKPPKLMENDHLGPRTQ